MVWASGDENLESVNEIDSEETDNEISTEENDKFVEEMRKEMEEIESENWENLPDVWKDYLQWRKKAAKDYSGEARYLADERRVDIITR